MTFFRRDTSHGELVINSYSLHTFAWCARDIRPLYFPDTFRGNNVTIPGVNGRRAYPYRTDEKTYTIPMFFTPACSTNGTDFGSLFTGYQTNITAFRTQFLTPPSSPTATLSATISTPAGSTLSASVQVIGFDLGDTDQAVMSRYVWRAALGIRIPAGYFS